MKALKYVIVLILVLAGAFFLWSRYNTGQENATQLFKQAAVTKGDILAMVASTGRLNPLNTIKVGTQVSGTVKEIYADFNSAVKKDQVVALIDPAIYAAQVAQAKAQLLKVRAQLEESNRSIEVADAGIKSAAAQVQSAQVQSAQATLKDARLKYKRLAKLGDVIAQADVDAALAKRDNAKGVLDMAKATVLSAKAQFNRTVAQKKGVAAAIYEKEAALNLAQIKLRYCTISSPIDGVVISRDVDVGQTVAATLQSPVLFTIAEDLTRMQVEVDVSEADVGRIKNSQGVIFSVDAFVEKKFGAKVREVRNAATNIQNVITYKVVADVDNNNLLLRPGMTANVNIVVAKVKGVLKLPNGALRFKPPGESKAARPAKSPPVRERKLFKTAVQKIGLDNKQSAEFEAIIKTAGQKLKAAYALPEEERDIKQAWKTFYTQIMTRLYRILRTDQHERFQAYVAERKAAFQKNRSGQGRPAKVYILDEDGKPQQKNITVGITNDDETQIVAGGLEEGDKVVVGFDFSAEGTPKKRGSLMNTLFRRR
jgi:HlyD family secretion protein